MNQLEIEKVKLGFDRAKLIAARQKSWEGVRQIASAMKPGMDEAEAYDIARAILRGLGSQKDWHRVWVRFGPSTIHPYGVVSAPGIKLQENDIFFVDIGPVWDGYEGDAGDTFAVGNNPEFKRCQEDVRKIFNLVKERWAGGISSGQELYAFAQKTAQDLGWRFNTRGASGHRLADFPHKVYFRGNLMERDFVPSACAWMLEIQIRHPEKEFGAFYEDLLF